ncbi:MAG: 50S ribosomal protein L11 methyltransferase, partial [Candidatus Eremiobacterota bacterium]
AAPLDWLEVELTGPVLGADDLGILLERRHIPGWVDESADDGLRWVFYLPREPGWKERLGSLGLSAAEKGYEMRIRTSVRDEDWAENWKQFYHPRRLGRRLVLRPTWEDFEAKSDDLVMALDPGMAFGTGYHASTRLCLELLERAPCPGRVLDYGTGSGILAIAALLLGARRAVCVDCDPVAVRAARDNLRQNRLSGRARVRLGEQPPRSRYDLVMANLVAQVLVELSAELTGAAGRLIAGGIVEERRDEVVEAYQARGMRLVDEALEEGWVALGFDRP